MLAGCWVAPCEQREKTEREKTDCHNDFPYGKPTLGRLFRAFWTRYHCHMLPPFFSVSEHLADPSNQESDQSYKFKPIVCLDLLSPLKTSPSSEQNKSEVHCHDDE